MNELEKNTKEFKIVHMYETDFSTDEKPIIGTDALATCIGVLLYEENKREAIVAHVAPAQFEIVKKIIELMEINKWNVDSIKYKIIPGYYEEHYNTKEFLEDVLSVFKPFEKSEISSNAIKVNKEFECHSFAFDSRTGKFVTDKVLFSEEYYKINNKIKR